LRGLAANHFAASRRGTVRGSGRRDLAGMEDVAHRHRPRPAPRGLRSFSMRAIPLSYVLRNLWFHRITTVLTAGGMALVVFVFATVMMMSEGINETMVATGQPDNVVALRKGAGAEINSVITREQASEIENVPGVATDSLGRKLAAREVVVLNNLPKRNSADLSNVTVRGSTAIGMALRPQIQLVQGRMFRPGTSEIVAGQAIAKGFAKVDVGQNLYFAGREWQVVGIF